MAGQQELRTRAVPIAGLAGSWAPPGRRFRVSVETELEGSLRQHYWSVDSPGSKGITAPSF